MKHVLRFAGTIALLLFVAARPASAASILYFSDLSLGPDRMELALAFSGQTVTTASSIPDFTTQLIGGGFDLAVFFEQNSNGADYDAAFAAMTTFLGGGGRAIAADWSRNGTHSAGFQNGFTGNIDDATVTVTDASLLTGIVNPIVLTNPGWGVLSTGLTNGATCGATFSNAECAIVIGNGGRSIFNGFLNDTFDDGAQGVQLFTNEINAVLGAQQVPEPTSVILLGTGLVGLVRWRCRG